MSSLPFDPNTTPALMPPDGVVPNFENPDSNAYISTNVIAAFLPLMVLFLFLRLYSRAIVIHKFGVDDAFSVVAAASVVVVCGILLSLNDHVNGRHQWDVPLSFLTDDYLKTNFSFVLLTAISAMLVKLSLLLLYLRIFKPAWKVTLTIYACIGIVSLFYLSTMIAELVVGVPKGGGTWQQAQAAYGPFGLTISVVRGVFGVLSDFVILLIPMTQLVLLALPTRRKVVLVGVFLTGILACASSIASTVFRFGELDNYDNTWANTLPNAFAIIEITVGHICCSLPTLPPLFVLLGKSKTIHSIMGYIRSNRAKKGESDLPTSATSDAGKKQLPNVPKGGLTVLKSFIRNARFTSVLTKPTRNSTNEESYYDLESVDVDYHSQLKTANKAHGPTRQV
ncbi:hypothetical protein NUW58_g6268 [Xylaria curta]|uniref:Uncharacterized protein n=1 Tax=Xylaria curta TaxID=42375 RepID=A0ACC1NYG0_9PEZI|nr:hypothetical protein NUW58_g6268 [Xylaria curta]